MKIKKMHRNMAIALVVVVVVVVALTMIHAFRKRETFSQHPQIIPLNYRDVPGMPPAQQRIRMLNPPNCTLSDGQQRR